MRSPLGTLVFGTIADPERIGIILPDLDPTLPQQVKFMEKFQKNIN
jgi:hypothetical protein